MSMENLEESSLEELQAEYERLKQENPDIEQNEELQDQLGYPKEPATDSIYKFFRDILQLKDTKQIVKVGNLEKSEIGILKLPVRNYLDIGNYARGEGLDIVANYLDAKATNIVTTSLSKDAKLVQLFVTQIKKQMKQTIDDKPRPKRMFDFGGSKDEG